MCKQKSATCKVPSGSNLRNLSIRLEIGLLVKLLTRDVARDPTYLQDMSTHRSLRANPALGTVRR